MVAGDLSVAAARALHLAAQGFHQRSRRRATKEDVLAAIRRMGALQIDTISVVARSPYLVLWSRLGSYEPRWLDELLAEGKLFEYWSHAACFLPIEEYRLYRRRMLEGNPRARAWIDKNPEVAARILEEVRRRGEVRSSDFERTDGKGSGWWSWKPEKLALEVLFWTGDLMIARREGFQRIYAPRESVVPSWDDVDMPAAEESAEELALKAIRALGVAKSRWLPDYFRTPSNGVQAMLDRLADEDRLIRVGVEGWKVPGYVHPDNASLLESAATSKLRPTLTMLLSPFDPVVWHRQRVEELFGFTYRIEVYTPAARRRYGYFTLPILHRGRLVGRLDPKAHRKEGIFEVRSIHLEPGVRVTEELTRGMQRTLADCAAWHRTPEIVVRGSDPPALAAALGFPPS
jgi:uncharacterized protein